MNSDDSFLRRIYDEQCNSTVQNSRASRMNITVDLLGFSFLRNNYDVSCNYLPLMKRTIRDIFIQEWKSTINNMPSHFYFNKVKNEFSCSEFVHIMDNDKLRKQITTLRLSSHKLQIEPDRSLNIPRENRLCKMCTYM